MLLYFCSCSQANLVVKCIDWLIIAAMLKILLSSSLVTKLLDWLDIGAMLEILQSDQLSDEVT